MMSEEMSRRLVELFVTVALIGACVAALGGCAAFRDTGSDPRDFFERIERNQGKE